MGGGDARSGALFSYVDLEARAGKTHPLRAIRQLVTEALTTLEKEFSALYSPMGRPSIPPEKLLRAMLSQALYSIRSERQPSPAFTAVTESGCSHTAITGSGPKAAKTPAFKSVNTMLGNVKAALLGTYRAMREKHAPRSLAEFEYRFNRRYGVGQMIPRLAVIAARTAPMPYRILELADFQA
jgi:hypothetical protein